MNQVLHIFRKDVRHLWLEIVISLAALGFATWTEWRAVTPRHVLPVPWSSDTLVYLVLFLAWWVMIVRIVHSEPPAGDRQFWITRPYVWYRLLLAKVLFVAVFIGTPLGVSQIVLLMVDRAPVGLHLGSVLSNTVLVLLTFMLPVAALAVLTRKLSQWLMIAFGVVLAFFLFASFGSILMLRGYGVYVPTGGRSDTVSVIEAILFFGLMATGVVIQYARRRRWFALVVMLAGIAAFPLITAFVPWESMMASAYPPAVRGQVPYTVALVPKNAPDKGTELDFDKKHVQLSVPVEVSGVPTDTLVDIEAARFYIDLPNGGQWDSKWQGGAQPITDEKKVVALSLLMDRDVYEQVKSSPVSVHMTIAVQELKDADPKRVVVQPTFQMPQVGLCWVQQEYGIECRSTRLGPKHLLMTMVQAENTCEQDGADANARPVRRMLSGVAPINPLSPLALAPFYFAMWNYEQRQNAGQVCPGTPVTVSTPHFSRRFRYDMELGRLTLPNYEFRYGAGSGSIGISVAVPVR